jgi:NAD(P)H dehydrogenase (quinone)
MPGAGMSSSLKDQPIVSIAVTGATGSLGTLVINGLLESQDPQSVIAIVRDPAKAASLAERGVQVRQATYGDPAALETALAGVDTLLLISGSEVGQRVQQHTNVVNAAKAAGVEHIVYTSAPKADTSPLILAPEHKATEEIIKASGITWTFLRNNWYTENYASQIDLARQFGAITNSVGRGKVASASRADFAAAAVAVLTSGGHENRIYELTGDHAWDFNEFAAAVGEVIGSEVVYKPVSPEEEAEILTQAGLDEGTVGFVVGLNHNIAEGTLGEATSDLRTLIGRPTTPLAEGLRATIA